MAAAFVQSKSALSSASAGSIAITFTNPVASGNLVCGCLQAGNQTATITSIADNVSGNTYTVVDTITDSANNNRAWSFYGKNIVNGPTVITVTFGANHAFRGLTAHEASGVDTTTAIDQHTAQRQTPAPGTTGDAVTSGSVTTTANGEYIFGGTIDTTGGHTPPEFTQGTGYTKREESGVAGAFNIASEDQIQTSLGSIAATFTQANNDIPITFIMTFFAAAAGVTATLSGTATASITEADIVAGGKTVILTISGDVWLVSAGGLFDGQRQNIINGMDSAQAEGTGWDAVVKATQGVTGVVRTSDTVVTITLDAFASYNITATETITVTVPATALLLGGSAVASPTFTVSALTGAAFGTGSKMPLLGAG